jgi:hypothetical protein
VLSSVFSVIPPPDIDLDLMSYAKVVCALMDIPVADNKNNDKASSEKKKQPLLAGQEQQQETSRSMIEALHLLFEVYAEFKNSAHFGSRQQQQQQGEGGDDGMSSADHHNNQSLYVG